MSDAPLTKCPKCKTGKVRRLVGAGAGFVFKGTGFYETDYKHPHPPAGPAPKPCADCPKKTKDAASN
jgi:predicted nucleic acid-binding Zn ribbon protein